MKAGLKRGHTFESKTELKTNQWICMVRERAGESSIIDNSAWFSRWTMVPLSKIKK
jgi:hypothetical protein